MFTRKFYSVKKIIRVRQKECSFQFTEVEPAGVWACGRACI